VPRLQTVKGSVKRLSDITVVDLHTLGIRDINRILSTLPIVIAQVRGEILRRQKEGLISTGSGTSENI